MPKLQNHRASLKGRKKLIPLLTVLIVIVACAGILFLTLHHNDSRQGNKTATNGIDYSPATKSDNTPNEMRKNAASQDSSSTSDTSSDSSTTQPAATTLNAPATPPPFSVTISSVNKSSDGVRAAATINGATKSGTCTFIVAPHSGQGQSYTQSESSSASNTTYVCPFLDIPAPSGTWDVSVSVTVDGSTATNKWGSPVSI